MVTAEKNTNPFANGNVQNVCGDASLPATPELRGITPLIDPDVDVDGAAAALSQSSAGSPLAADGLSVFDLMDQAGLGDLVTAQGGAGGAAAGGAAAGGNQNAGNANNNQQDAAQGGNQAADNNNQQDAAAGQDNAAADDGTAIDCNAGNAGQDNNAAAGNGQAANNGTAAAGNGNANQNQDQNANQNAGNNNANQNQNQNVGNNNQGAANNANNNQDAAAGNNNNQGAADNANNNQDGAADTGAAAGGAADFGQCTPTIFFAGGQNGRPADEFTFQIEDPLARGGQGEALNPDIITNALCNQLTNVCEANDAAVAQCESAKAAVKGGARDQSTADTFNSLVLGGAAGARKMRRGLRA
jgi:hypothetical protein